MSKKTRPCNCGGQMQEMYVCLKCGHMEPIIDPRQKLQEMIQELDSEQIDTLIRTLEDKY